MSECRSSWMPIVLIAIFLMMASFLMMTSRAAAQRGDDPLPAASESAERREAAGVVALDERQHYQGGHQAGPGVDASSGLGDSRTLTLLWERRRLSTTAWHT